MKVFLSWSGPLSHKLACIFRDWLPQVINSVHPYVSSEDIDKGTRWSIDIAKELEASSFGLIFVTPENIAAAWINFEAGALSKMVDRDHVAPFLFQLKRSELQGPLLQFQSTIYEKADIEKLVCTLNRCLPEADQREEVPLRKAFEVWWPELQRQLDALGKLHPPAPQLPETSDLRRPSAILEEVLELVRSQYRLLKTPEVLFPRDYFESLFRHALPPGEFAERTIERVTDLHDEVRRLEKVLSGIDQKAPGALELDELRTQVGRFHDAVHALDSRLGRRSRLSRPRPAGDRGPSEPNS